jgi:hypothetical protein
VDLISAEYSLQAAADGSQAIEIRSQNADDVVCNHHHKRQTTIARPTKAASRMRASVI